MPAERLQKIIAAAGVASRRKAEELITSGRVQVNGKMVTELGTKADPERDHIRVDGKLLHGPERYSYIVLNKPKGYVTTVSDPEKRPTVMDLVRSVRGRVYPVGRLDWASEGLLLLTNDGELANALMKASSNVSKTYVVKVAGQPEESKLEKLRRGVSIAEKGGRRVRTAPARIKLIREGDNPWLEVTIVEGRNRQVRKMFEEVGHHVEKIRRVQYGPLSLDVPPGEFRSLSLEEVAKLKKAASGSKAARPRAAGKMREQG
jgi:23S rRNA pseudouridine2605 synthase